MDKMRKIGFYLISTLIYKQMWQQVGPNPVIVSSTEWHNGNHKSYFFSASANIPKVSFHLVNQETI